VVPKLKKINPAITTAVSNMCSSLREDEDFLFSTAKKIYTLCLREYWLDKELLTLQHPAVCKRVISLYLAEQFGATCDNFHLEKCLEILKRGGRTGLSGNLSAECSADRFFVIRNGEKILQNPGYKVETKKYTLENLTKINNLFLKNAIDCDKIEGSLVVRVKNEGDAIRLNNRNCTKSLKKLFNELKIPKELREYIPVAADDGGIVWVYGVGIDGRVAIDENTKTAIEFVTTK
jgi:tRNA(Ile)-lysidine synthase